MESKTYTVGLKQYLFNSLELGIEYSNQEMTSEGKHIWFGDFEGTTEEKRLTGRAKLIIADTVGILAEYGSGEIEEESSNSSTPTSYDVKEATAELQLYAGKGFSIRVGANVSTEAEKDLPAGDKNETIEARSYIAPKLWFGERFGIELVAYSLKVEENSVDASPDDTTYSHTESGGEVNLSFRF